MNANIFNTILDFLGKFLSKKEQAPAPIPTPEPKPEPAKEEKAMNWDDPSSKISKYFTIKDAIALREWGRLANSSDGLDDHVKSELVRIFQMMDTIREFLNKPVFIKSAYRPEKYNVSIGGATFSAHMAKADYAAVDFWCDADGDGDKDGEDCDYIKAALMPKLAEWNIRMEDNGQGARWVHIDNKKVAPGGNRFFKP